jgi:hypothetical protein
LVEVALLKRTGHDHHWHASGTDIGLQHTQDLKPTQGKQFEIQQNDLRQVGAAAVREGSFTKKELKSDSSVLEVQNADMWMFRSERAHGELRVVKIVLDQKNINQVTHRLYSQSVYNPSEEPI